MGLYRAADGGDAVEVVFGLSSLVLKWFSKRFSLVAIERLACAKREFRCADQQSSISLTLTTRLVQVSEALTELVSPLLIGIVADSVSEFVRDGKVE
jgi:hypothetical protein